MLNGIICLLKNSQIRVKLIGSDCKDNAGSKELSNIPELDEKKKDKITIILYDTIIPIL